MPHAGLDWIARKGWHQSPHGSDALGVHPVEAVGPFEDVVALALERAT